MNKTNLVMIAKRGGGCEPFDFNKLRRSVAAAMESCGYDARYATALARAVEVHLAEWDKPRPPTAEYIFRCARAVLDQTGLEDAARAFEQHRRDRSQRRQKLRVIDSRRPARAPGPWSKAPVAASLMRRYQLSSATARILASEIEAKVLGLNYARITSAMIAELIRCELTAWGLICTGEAETPQPTEGC